jgi:hypothetical protein
MQALAKPAAVCKKYGERAAPAAELPQNQTNFVLKFAA